MAGASDIAMIMLVLAGLYILIKSGKLEELFKGGLPALPPLPGLPAPSGGDEAPSGPISGGGSCPGGVTCGPSQKGRWECEGINNAAYEATWCGTFSGDRLSIKMYGPGHHADGDCCWCILYIEPGSGQFIAGGEGPHPNSNCDKAKGSSLGSTSNVCIKGVMTPGPTLEGYGLVGGQWKKMIAYKGPCGCDKTATKSTGGQVSFRCDGSIQTKCATVRPLGGGGGAPASPAQPAGGGGPRIIKGSKYATSRSRQRSRYNDIQNSILSRI